MQCTNCLESWEYDKFIFCCPIPVLLVVYWNVWTSLLCKSEIAVYCSIFNKDLKGKDNGRKMLCKSLMLNNKITPCLCGTSFSKYL